MNFRKPWMFPVIFLMVSVCIVVVIYTDIDRLAFKTEKTREERIKDLNSNYSAVRNGQSAYNAGDYKSAFNDWLPLAEEGNYAASRKIGDLYFNGAGVLQNYTQAFKFYRLSAEQGNLNAYLLIGRMYDEGKGVVQDNVRAHMWYNIAAANGNQDAAGWRAFIEKEKRMSPEAVEKAQSMAAECMSSGYEKCGW